MWLSMELLLELLVALWIAVLSWLAAERMIATGHRWRWLVVILALILLLAVAVFRRRPDWALGPLITMARTPGSAWIYALAVPLLLLVPAAQLRFLRERYVVRAFTALIVLWQGIAPLAAPHCYGAFYADIPTVFDAHGVCRQRESFTCGPAAAVTALSRLGIAAETAELSRLARTNPWFGSPPADLLRAINRAGVSARLARWNTVEQLSELSEEGEGAEVALLIVRGGGLLQDHWVVWLGRDRDGAHVIADPDVGLRVLTSETLHQWWRGRGIVLTASGDQAPVR